LEDFHLGVEALCDAVVASEPPHGGNLGDPGRERLAELYELSQAGLAQLVQRFEEAFGERLALLAGTVFFEQQVAEALFESVDFPQGRELVKGELQPDSLLA